MGVMKTLKIEYEELGFCWDDDKSICPSCFDERGVKAFIEKNLNENRSCSYCANSPYKGACSFKEVMMYVMDRVRLEYCLVDNAGFVRENGEDIYFGEIWEDFLEILSYEDATPNHDSLKEDIVDSVNVGKWCKKNPYSLAEHETLKYGWEGFCRFVKNKSRYLFLKAENEDYDRDQPDEMNPVKILHSLGIMVEDLGLISSLKRKFYRARVVNIGENPHLATDLGSPPEGKASIPNRMSPAGISMFYGSFNKQTALDETYVQGGKKKKIVMSIFEPLRSLKLLDLTKVKSNIPSLFDEKRCQDRQNTLFLKRFVKDISQEIDRKDGAYVDYVPTQIVAEYFRLIFRFKKDKRLDGIIYPSAKNKGGKNVVIFANNEQCVDTPSGNKSELLQLIHHYKL